MPFQQQHQQQRQKNKQLCTLTSLLKYILGEVIFLFLLENLFLEDGFEQGQCIRNKFYCSSLKVEDLLTLEMVAVEPIIMWLG